MLEDNYRLLFVLTDLILPLIVGYFLHKNHLITDRINYFIIKFNILGICTLTSLFSFWALPLNWDVLILLPFGSLFVIVPGVVGYLTFAKRYKNMLSQGSYIMSVMLSNVGTLGGVCAFILYSDVGFAYSQIIASCQNFLLVVLCFPLAQYYYNRHISAFSTELKKTSILKKFVSWNQISVVGICIGLFLNARGVERPEVLTNFFHFLVHFGAWVALVPVGFLINFSKIRHYYFKVFDIVIVRFLIVPASIYITAHIFFTDRVLLNSLLICAIAPTAINAVLTAKLYKLNVNLPVASFVSTTALFLVVIFPIVFFILK
ncbi:AEC family transporter [Succinivibrio dextrinosolvens]|uniref:AEC family transporter n=1 Tax=Succinivibrio dextrinosolvens TaxID=83771 RepID=UPI00247A5A6B|nr:hypothetical protein [Succinivibrio dextrinosolvens]